MSEIGEIVNGLELELDEARQRIAALEAELATLKAAHEWRPVTEAPPRDDRYAILMRFGNGIRANVATWKGAGTWNDSAWVTLGNSVLYWMPLPPAPEAGQE